MEGLASGMSSGMGQAMGTSAAGSAAGQAAASTAASTTGGQIGSAMGQAMGNSANQGAMGDLTRLFTNGSTQPAQGTSLANMQAGMGGGGAKQGSWAPQQDSYMPGMGAGAAQAAMPRRQQTHPAIALQLLQNLPQTQPYV